MASDITLYTHDTTFWRRVMAVTVAIGKIHPSRPEQDDRNMYVERLGHLFVENGICVYTHAHYTTTLTTNITNRATRMLNFIKRNLGNVPTKLNPKLIHHLSAQSWNMPWDPYQKSLIYKIEMIQRRVGFQL